MGMESLRAMAEQVAAENGAKLVTVLETVAGMVDGKEKRETSFLFERGSERAALNTRYSLAELEGMDANEDFRAHVLEVLGLEEPASAD